METMNFFKLAVLLGLSYGSLATRNDLNLPEQVHISLADHLDSMTVQVSLFLLIQNILF